MNRHCLLKIMCGLFAQTWAISAFSLTPDVLLVNAGVGYSSMSVVPTLSNPIMATFSVGGMIATRVAGSNGLLGVSSDFDLSRQLSNVADSGGSYSGRRWNILAPTAGYQAGSWIILGALELLGSYSMSSPSLSGASVSFGSPFGGKFRVLKQCWGEWGVGVQAELLGFGSRNDIGLVNRQKFFLAGLLLSRLF